MGRRLPLKLRFGYERLLNQRGHLVLRHISNGNERTKTIDGYSPLVLNPVAALHLLSLPFSNKEARVVTRVLMTIFVSACVVVNESSSCGAVQ